MKKVLNSAKNSGPSKLVRRILSKTSTTAYESTNTSTNASVISSSNISTNTTNNNSFNLSINNSTNIDTKPKNIFPTNSRSKKKESQQMPIDLELEIGNLNEQVGKLQIIIDDLHTDSETKEKYIANLARDKEKLTCDLQKEKRSYKRLKRQLDDEREFYFREKESYCKEMNECKKITQKLGLQNSTLDLLSTKLIPQPTVFENPKLNPQNTKLDSQNTESDHTNSKLGRKKDTIKEDTQKKTLQEELAAAKKEITKLERSLEMFSESNYNLSVKFLRMKNTKYSLKNRLQKLKSLYDKLKVESQTKIALMKNELSDLLNNHYQIAIHPSNKRYLHLVKENGTLIHENLCLQLEVDRLNLEVERIRMMEIRKETNSKLKYINSKTRNELFGSLKSEACTSSQPSRSLVNGRGDCYGKENVIDDLIKECKCEATDHAQVERLNECLRNPEVSSQEGAKAFVGESRNVEKKKIMRDEVVRRKKERKEIEKRNIERRQIEKRSIESREIERKEIKRREWRDAKTSEVLTTNSSGLSVKKIFERKESVGFAAISFLKEKSLVGVTPPEKNPLKNILPLKETRTVREMRDFLEDKYKTKITESNPDSHLSHHHLKLQHKLVVGSDLLSSIASSETAMPSSMSLCNVSEISMQTCLGSSKHKEREAYEQNLNKRDLNERGLTKRDLIDRDLNKRSLDTESKSSQKENSKTDLLSESLYYFLPSEAIRTQSAPEIVQSSCFVNQT